MPDREAILSAENEHRSLAWADPAKAAERYAELLERVAVLTEEVAEWKAASMHHDPESGVKANAAGWCVSWKAERRRVAVLTEERDEARRELREFHALHIDEDDRVAVLEAGLLHYWLNEGSCPCGARRENPIEFPHSIGCPVGIALDLLGGVPADG